MRKIPKLFIVLMVCLAVGGLSLAILSPVAVKASSNTVGTLSSYLSANSIPELIGDIIKAVLGIVGAVALLMFIYGGFVWMTSAGNPKRVGTGRDTLVWASIGLLVIFSAYLLVRFVLEAIGAS